MPFISYRTLGILAGVFTLLLIIIRAPATLLPVLLKKALPVLELQTVTGSFWQGKAAGAQWNASPTPLALGAVSWQLQPLKLAALKLCVAVKNEHFSGEACKSALGATTLRNVKAEIPAGLINPALSSLNAAIDGTLLLQLPAATLTAKNSPSLIQGQLAWRGAKININNMAYPLGDYQAALSANTEGALVLHITDEAGPIKVDVNAQWPLGGAPSVQGQVNPSEQAPAAVRDALSLVATPGENGALTIKYPLGG